MTEKTLEVVQKKVIGFTSFDGLTFYASGETEADIENSKKRCKEYEQSARNVPFGRLCNKGLIKDFDPPRGIRSFLEFYEGDDYHSYLFKPETLQDVSDFAVYGKTGCDATVLDGKNSSIENLEPGKTYLVFGTKYNDYTNCMYIYTSDYIYERLHKEFSDLQSQLADAFNKPVDEPKEDEKCTTQ